MFLFHGDNDVVICNLTTMAETDAESVRTESQAGEELYLSELSPEQLRALIQDTSHALSTLKAETEMFDKFYKRLDPKELTPAALSEAAASPLDFNQMRSRRRSKSRSTISERLLSLSVEQKSELVQRELEESWEEAQKDADNTERILQSYKVSIGRGKTTADPSPVHTDSYTEIRGTAFRILLLYTPHLLHVNQ